MDVEKAAHADADAESKIKLMMDLGIQGTFEELCKHVPEKACFQWVSLGTGTQKSMGRIDCVLVEQRKASVPDRHFDAHTIKAVLELKKKHFVKGTVAWSSDEIGQAAEYARHVLKNSAAASRDRVLFFVSDLDHVQIFSVSTSSDVLHPFCYERTDVLPDVKKWLTRALYMAADFYTTELHFGREPLPQLTPVGEGLTSQVFQTTLGGDVVAVKVLRPKYVSARAGEAVGLCAYEVGVLKQLEGIDGVPSVVCVLNGDAGFVMKPFLNRKIPVSPSLQFLWLHFSNLVSILRCVHERNYVHRDIRPTNIMTSLSKTYLIDWGYAARVDDPDMPYENKPILFKQYWQTRVPARSQWHTATEAAKRTDYAALRLFFAETLLI
eukprot:m51a1_g10886 hypothetical protein (381) ;mRNA; f:362-1883